jgi:MYXO-CTERM domain-containing protein
VTPAAVPMDGYVAVTGWWSVAGHADHAAIVRTNPQGFFDARNGDTYASDTAIPYVAGQAYQVAVDLDVPGQVYDVTVDGVPLATGYAFRLPAPQIGQATAWHASGGLAVEAMEVSGERASPDPPCRPDAGPDAGGDGPDATVSPDASGVPPGGIEGGCACSTGRGGEGEALLAMTLLLLWLAPRRRRRT